MTTRKRSRPEIEDAPNSRSFNEDSSTTLVNNSELATTNKRARKSAPIDKILNVVELCEQVLSHLPMNDLLHAMQVCRILKADIDSSHKLQHNLFLAPDLKRQKLTISSTGALLSGVKAAQHIAAARAAGRQTVGEITCCTLHPALQLDPESHRVLSAEGKRQGIVEYAAQRFDPSFLVITDSVTVRNSILSSTKNGSNAAGLGGMLITQPPVPSVVVYVAFDADGYGVCYHRPSSNTAGVTFGDVFKTVAEIQAKYWRRLIRGWWISFDCRVFVVSDQAREAVERAGELTSEEDPTRWVVKDRQYVLKEGGFVF